MKISNRWKAAFFILSGSIMIIVVGFFVFLFIVHQNMEEISFQPRSNLEGEGHFTISTSRDKLNRLVANRLKDEGAPYVVYLTEEHLIFQSTLAVLGQVIPLEMKLSPTVVAGGDVVLQLENLSLSGVPLPSTYVLQAVKDFVALPVWVSIYPRDEMVHIITEDIAKERGLIFRFIELDLRTDTIVLEMEVMFNRLSDTVN